MASHDSERDNPIPLPSPLQSHPPDFPTDSHADTDPAPVSPISSIFQMSTVPTWPGFGAGLRMVSPSPPPTAVGPRPLLPLPFLDTSPEVARQEPAYVTRTRLRVERRIRYLPEWETPRNPPKRSMLQQTRNLLSSMPFFESRKQPSFVKKQHKPRSMSIPSLFSLMDPPVAEEKDEAMPPNDQHGANNAGWRKSLGFGYGKNSSAGLDLERHGEGGIVPTHTVTTLGSIPNPPPPPRLTEKERMRSWVNRRLLPPEKQYPFGLNRRRFCLFVLLPLLLLLLLGLTLGLGLGLGLKHNDDDSDLPILPPLGEDPPMAIHQATFNHYFPSNGTGACGYNITNDEVVVAISYKIWDEAAKQATDLLPQELQDSSLNSDPNTNPLCGKVIWLGRNDDFENRDHWIQARVADRCAPERCPDGEDLDLTEGAFQAVYKLGLGSANSDQDPNSDAGEEQDGGKEGWWVWDAEADVRK
ncbi:hypothetical protein GE21DRAFT_3674 [Neurospora crassa]|uniref:Uncharacterized protein n=1 Tax=Neurospora crassa (strain ATCC 24698 / 74-OR23-1A / CBS 708.71 / DSM 1257 / FGSC 987) TaxID=367110 RepID=Q7S131_NEUCR|nr:hypothetical protein NCU09336 [Neurospora crassa OR74A]EAA29057.1 hypothetical protein NCU09336 [Neurospora crassa OR74A]KHE87272.1 hypothetical protein GE21DRAFT_3674 [Neurospora crassa]|eukprot:XP_958293.1 hypothetical protein NCU09336 [Neurospora crassa OR74A]